MPHNQSDVVNPRDDYTLRKLLLVTDTIRLMFRPESVADHVAKVLQHARVGVLTGVLPGPLCNGSLHTHCIGQADLHTIVSMERESRNRGRSVRHSVHVPQPVLPVCARAAVRVVSLALCNQSV